MLEWARVCRLEAIRTTHEGTKSLLGEIAAEFETLAGQPVKLDVGGSELQNAAADRLVSLSAKRWFGVSG